MTKWNSWSMGALCVLLAAATGSADERATQPPVSGALKLSDCRLPELDEPARCGVLEVPENPDRPQGRRIALQIGLLPATGGRALPDPIVVLMGGPGEDAISAAGYFARQFASLRTDRDLLLIDQRGTGLSSALRCDLFDEADATRSLRDFIPADRVERCAREHAARADLTQYGTARVVEDFERIRRALGYQQFNLYAGSYGTRTAQVYVREHPGSVRTVYMGSIVPIDVVMPLPMPRAAQIAMDATFEACAAQPDCHAAFPRLREEFRDVIARLDRDPPRVSVTGRTEPAVLDRGRVGEWLRARLYRPASATELPWLIHQAHQGNFDSIARGIIADAPQIDTAYSFGVLLSITCNEDVVFVRESDVARESEGTFLRDYRLRQQQAACNKWPGAPVAAEFKRAVRSPVPALFVSGDSDGGSPLWFTGHAAPGFSNRAEVVMRGQGHTEWNDCVGRIYERFVRSGEARGLDVDCPAAPRPAFRTR